MREGVHKVVKSVAAPLHFFSLLIIAILFMVSTLAWKSNLPSETTFNIICFLIVFLVLIVGLVVFLVIKHPRKLTFDKESYIIMMRESLSDSEMSRHYIPTDVIMEKPPKLINKKTNGQKPEDTK